MSSIMQLQQKKKKKKKKASKSVIIPPSPAVQNVPSPADFSNESKTPCKAVPRILNKITSSNFVEQSDGKMSTTDSSENERKRNEEQQQSNGAVTPGEYLSQMFSLPEANQIESIQITGNSPSTTFPPSGAQVLFQQTNGQVPLYTIYQTLSGPHQQMPQGQIRYQAPFYLQQPPVYQQPTYMPTGIPQGAYYASNYPYNQQHPDPTQQTCVLQQQPMYQQPTYMPTSIPQGAYYPNNYPYNQQQSGPAQQQTYQLQQQQQTFPQASYPPPPATLYQPGPPVFINESQQQPNYPTPTAAMRNQQKPLPVTELSYQSGQPSFPPLSVTSSQPRNILVAVIDPSSSSSSLSSSSTPEVMSNEVVKHEHESQQDSGVSAYSRQDKGLNSKQENLVMEIVPLLTEHDHQAHKSTTQQQQQKKNKKNKKKNNNNNNKEMRLQSRMVTQYGCVRRVLQASKLAVPLSSTVHHALSPVDIGDDESTTLCKAKLELITQGNKITPLNFAEHSEGIYKKQPSILQSSIKQTLAAKIKLRTTKNTWKINRKLKPPTDLQLCKDARAILSKITSSNFAELCAKFLKLEVHTREESMNTVIDFIFNKAVSQPKYCQLYSDLCKEQVKLEMKTTGSKSNFRSGILSKCQQMFETNTKREEVLEQMRREAEAQTDKQKRAQLLADCDGDEYMEPQRRFIGHLYRNELLVPLILQWCIVHLFQRNANTPGGDEESIECAVKMLETIGEIFDRDSAKDTEMAQKTLLYYQHLQEISIQVSDRVRFRIKNLIELRNNGWVRRQSACDGETNKQKFFDAIRALFADRSRLRLLGLDMKTVSYKVDRLNIIARREFRKY